MLIDLQVNGYLNVEFSSEDLSKETCRTTFRKYLESGADSFLPTVITNSAKIYKRNLSIISEVIDEKEFSNKIPGIHCEGPFISREPGAVGAHSPEYVIDPDIDFFYQMQEWAKGKIILLTIAAEAKGAANFCNTISKTGVIISLGHQLAKYEDLCRLYDNGAKTITHLGNGMPNTVNRHDNSLINALIHPYLIPMIIADGHHLPASLVEGIVRVKGVSNVIVVSDASPLAGMPPGNYHTLGNNVVLEENGYLHNPEKKCLVGSSFGLKQCVDFLKNSTSLDIKDIQMLTEINPAQILNIS